jgi:hypothetical protein
MAAALVLNSSDVAATEVLIFGMDRLPRRFGST